MMKSNIYEPDELPKKTCLFDYYAIPYLGYYNPESYQLLNPTKMVKIKSYESLNKFQPKMTDAIHNFLKIHPQTEIQTVELYYNNFSIDQSSIKKRTNAVMHFLPMQNKKDLSDEAFHVRASIYTADCLCNLGITRDSDSNRTLQFNQENLDSEACVNDIFFHDKEFLSPDNCAIVLNHAYLFLSFGLVCIYKTNTLLNYQIFVAMYFINNAENVLYRNQQKLVDSALIHQLINYYILLSENLKKLC